ncbi:hypothetical protein [Dyella sp. C11]|uniref:hypothetical protein n=1 Tax=Dyella sp. C11 TaxID=2126991 RepID=UPI0013009231|nr:hypothetical protein [Dyella sp. C11]
MAFVIGAAWASGASAVSPPYPNTELFDRAADMVKGRQTMSASEIASALGIVSEGSSHDTQITFPGGTYLGTVVAQIRVATTKTGVPQFVEIVTDPAGCIDATALQTRYTADGLYDLPMAPAGQVQRYLTHEADGVRIAIGISLDPPLCAKSFIAEIATKPAIR